jgi:polyhydroxybutyrate depolymerase
MDSPEQQKRPQDVVDSPKQLSEEAYAHGSEHLYKLARNTKIDTSYLPSFELISPLKAGETNAITIEIDGEDRKVFLHLPIGYEPGKPVPLTLLFHGMNMPDGAKKMEAITGMSKYADQKGMAVAYLEADGDRNGFNNGQWLAESQDDLKLTKAVIEGLSKDLSIDPKRVYLAGFSWGGSFVHHAAADPEIASKVAAIAEVSGFMTGNERPTGQHISELSIHSKGDDTVYYEGRTSLSHQLVGLEQQPVRNTFTYYQAANESYRMAAAQDGQTADGDRYHIDRTSNPVDKSTVELITLENLKHHWPGGLEAPNSINATKIVTDFLLEHARE